MKTTENINPVGPCGINCGECECHTAKDDPALLQYLLSRGLKSDRLPCPGCRAVKGYCPAIGDTICATYTCATERGVEFCYECAEFPCSKLTPASDRANILPHNLKVFNLCYIQRQGLDKFLEKSSEFKQKYYKGKMAVGKGPQLD